MAKIYGADSAYIKGKKRFFDIRWAVFMAVFFGVIGTYFIVYINLQRLPTAVTLAGPFIFLGLLKFLDHFIDIYELGSIKAFRGLKAESEVLAALEKLPDNFTIFRGLQINGPWDVDFIVIGPTGVFTVEAKSHRGTIGFNGTQLTHNGYLFSEKDILKQAMSQALDTHGYLMKHTGEETFVKPILVFASAKVRFGLKPIHNVSVIGIKWLHNVISKADHKPYDYRRVVESLLPLLPKPEIKPETSKSL